MKLHRIEVQNLNSLYGDHQVDLDNELGGASLFLIQGPTGAGKSTLMDAVSLALFGTTPRMNRAGPERASSEKAVAEQIMSRGTGVARAAVEFSKWESGTRVRYRAVWLARRAREKSDGNMQNTERSMERRAGSGVWQTLVSDRRAKVVQPVFTAVLEGFSTEDFQRSMLLAQGNFDAMLRASPEERATILERLTDTSDYTLLGQRAAQVWGRWKQRIEGLRARRLGISPTSPEALAEARTTLAAAQIERSAVQSEVSALERLSDWLTRRTALVAAAAHAQDLLQQIRAERLEHAPGLRLLAEHERCAEALAARTDQQRLAREQLDNAAQIQAVEAALPPLRTAAATASEAELAHAAAVERGARALSALRAPAQRAVQTRAAAAHAQEGHDGAILRNRAAAQQRAGAAGRLDAAAAALQAAQQHREAAAAALGAVAQDAALHEMLADVRETCTRLRSTADAVGSDRKHHAERMLQLQSQQRALAARRAAHEAARTTALGPMLAALVAAQATLASLSQEAPPAAAVRAADAARQALRDRHRSLEDALRAVQELDQSTARERRSADAAEAAIQAQAAAATAQAAATTHRDTCRQQVGAAQAALAPLARIAALSAARAELGEHESCPLCASTDHPFRHDDLLRARYGAVDEELAGARARLELVSQQLTHAEQSLQSAQLQSARSAERTLQAVRARDEAAQDRARHATAARAACAAAAVPQDATAEQVRAEQDAVVEAGKKTARRLQELETAISTAAAAQATHDAEASRLQAAAQALALDAARLDQDRRTLGARTSVLDQAVAQLDQARAALSSRLRLLGVDHDHHRPEAALASVQRRVEQWRKTRDADQEAARAVVLATTTHTSAAEALATATQALERSSAELQDRASALATAKKAHSAAHAALAAHWQDGVASGLIAEGLTLPADPLGVAETALREQRATATALRAATQHAVQARTSAESRADTLRQGRDRLRVRQSAQHDLVQAHLSALELPDLAALDSIRLETARLQELRRLRDDLHTRHTQAGARVGADRASLEAHDKARPDSLPETHTAETIAEALAERTLRRAAIDERMAAAGATVRMAEEKAAELARLDLRIRETERNGAVWARLHELIGRADGRHFKEFAQALNLDQLLARANVHLARLSDRYRLQTVRDAETGLPTLRFCIRDQWRPGTTRPVRTLSGGESFLVSLAMALGLSDLRTSRMPVETLLLDEGFGTLDPRTLDTALAALQQLQASGRQVGIISHVVGLQESIPARILIEPQGEGRSRVRVCTS